jgi:hypothetical protein
MARTLNRLTAREVATATQPGMYADGAGLYLRVARGKSWVLRYMLDGKAREMGLGGLAKVGLADARKKAAEKRLLLADKIDPIERRKAVRGEKKIEATRTVTFDDCAAAYIKAHEPSWRHPKHHQQWTNSLVRYVSPAFGRVPAGSIDVGMVMNVRRKSCALARASFKPAAPALQGPRSKTFRRPSSRRNRRIHVGFTLAHRGRRDST